MGKVRGFLFTALPLALGSVPGTCGQPLPRTHWWPTGQLPKGLQTQCFVQGWSRPTTALEEPFSEGLWVGQRHKASKLHFPRNHRKHRGDTAGPALEDLLGEGLSL